MPDTCAMCGGRPADRGLLCAEHRAEDNAIQRFVDDVDPASRPPLPLRVVEDRK